eukprot:6188786-Pleurochrysis_carterae.AAC.3
MSARAQKYAGPRVHWSKGAWVRACVVSESARIRECARSRVCLQEHAYPRVHVMPRVHGLKSDAQVQDYAGPRVRRKVNRQLRARLNARVWCLQGKCTRIILAYESIELRHGRAHARLVQEGARVSKEGAVLA